MERESLLNDGKEVFLVSQHCVGTICGEHHLIIEPWVQCCPIPPPSCPLASPCHNYSLGTFFIAYQIKAGGVFLGDIELLEAAVWSRRGRVCINNTAVWEHKAKCPSGPLVFLGFLTCSGC